MENYPILSFMQNWVNNVKVTYNINPYIFAVLYFGCAPSFWYSVYKIIRCIKNRETGKLLQWIMVNLLSILAPFIYVAIFGRNLPKLFWLAVALFIGFSILSLVRKIKKGKAECNK